MIMLFYPFKLVWSILVWIEHFIEFLVIGILFMPFSVGKIHLNNKGTFYWWVVPIIVKWFLFIWFFAQSAIFIIMYATIRDEYWRKLAVSADQTANAAVNGNMDNTFSGRLGVKILLRMANAIEKRFDYLLSYFDPTSKHHSIDSIEPDEKAVID